MASLYRKPCRDLALECVGYKSDGLWNMYADRLDQCNFFAGCGKKNGAVDYCGIAYCYWLFMNVVTDSGDVDDNDRKYMTHYAMYQRDDCCTSAGCTQQAQAYKDNDAWYTNPQDLQVMDQIFFKKSNGDIYHTGACTDWGYNEEEGKEGAWVTEANVEGRQTLTRFYPYSEFGNKIAGFGRPRFDGWEQECSSENPSEPVASEPEPVVTEPVTEPRKSVEELAQEVLDGKWGNGKDRYNRLTDAGYDYNEVQDRVNEILYGKKEDKPTNPDYEVYTVQAGDTLWSISTRFLGQGGRYREIKSLNGLTSDMILTGQKLKIPKK